MEYKTLTTMFLPRPADWPDGEDVSSMTRTGALEQFYIAYRVLDDAMWYEDRIRKALPDAPRGYYTHSLQANLIECEELRLKAVRRILALREHLGDLDTEALNV